MRGFAIAFVLLLVLAVAGCSSKPAASSSPPSGTAAVPPVGSPTPSGAPKVPVSIHDTGDMAQGADKKYNWTLAAGFKKFTVQFQLMGPPGLPDYAVSNLNYKLVDGAGKSRGEQNGATAGLTTGGNGCVLCIDGKNGAAPGPWSFSFAAGPSAATYTFDVVAEY